MKFLFTFFWLYYYILSILTLDRNTISLNCPIQYYNLVCWYISLVVVSPGLVLDDTVLNLGELEAAHPIPTIITFRYNFM